LKSVAYQPLPFNWKPAAETFFTSASALHDGHVTSGASENFCRDSSSCPQTSNGIRRSASHPRLIGKALD
jgi:hypothetical protein